MLSSGELASMRATLDETLVDTCTITEAGSTAFNAGSGTYTDTPGSEVYSGACRVHLTQAKREADVGEGQMTLRLFDVALPWDTTGIKIDHVVTIDTSSDPALIDATFRVVDIHARSDVLYRRIVCQQEVP